MLAPERWARIRTLLEHVEGLPPIEREAYLDRACAHEPDLRIDVESLLRAGADADGFLDPADGPPLLVTIAPEPVLEPGTRLDGFEIVGPLGAGGMGHVYRARDTRLGRTVAIKVLAPQLADAPASQARFEREAQALSSLNHPHICVLHDAGRATLDDEREQLFLVTELIEGETLAARLARGPLPVALALEYATQIADALDAAHRQGIIHRDLKPANIMLTKAAGVKLLDFGLARLRPTTDRIDVAGVDRFTQRGVVVGTLPYMAPEQVRGEEADARSDLFAFGAVLYEMLAGRRPFDADSPTALMAQILERDPPPLIERAPHVPVALDRLIRTCLARDPAERWQDAHDVVLALREQRLRDEDEARGGRPRRAAVAGWAVAALLGATLLWVVLASPRPAGPPDAAPRTLMLDAAPVAAGWADAPRISPDGRMVAFLDHSLGNRGRLFIYEFDTGQTREVKGRPDAFYRQNAIAWSSDSRTMLYKAGTQVRALDVFSGADRLVAETSAMSLPHGGVAESAGGTILVGGLPLRRVVRGEGELVDVYRPDPRVTVQAWPAFLPNGRDFVFAQYARTAELTGIFLGSLDADATIRLHPVPSNAAVSRSGHLVFGSEGSLVAQPLDDERRALTGQPAVLARGVAGWYDIWDFTLGPDDTLAYVLRQPRAPSRLVWHDRTGAILGSVGEPDEYGRIALAPDGQHLAFVAPLPRLRRPGLGFLDLVRGTRISASVNFDLSGGTHIDGVAWSPDGRRVVFSNWGNDDTADFYIAGMGRTDTPVSFASIPGRQGIEQWTPDGRFLIFRRFESAGRFSLWAMPLEGDRTPVVLADGPYSHDGPKVSPDGRWLAYASDEASRYDVYVQRFREPSPRVLLSPDGGITPMWRADGCELFYLALDGQLMSLVVEDEGAFGEPQPLFRTPLVPASDISNVRHYAVSPDGKRFLIVTPGESHGAARMVVLANWPSLLSP